MKRPRVKIRWLITNILLLSISIVLVNQCIIYKYYTIYEDGRWDSAKTKVYKELMGSYAAIYTKPALFRNHLDISSWHGYQEFTLKNKINPRRISFSVQTRHQPFSFIIDKSDSVLRGIEFKLSEPDSLLLFTADADGRFLSQVSYPARGIFLYSAWNECRFERSRDTITLIVNNRMILKSYYHTAEYIKPGFKGSSGKVLIDNFMAIGSSGDKQIEDDFSPPFRYSIQTMWVSIFLLIPFFLIFFYSDYVRELTVLNLILCLSVVSLICLYFFWLSALYPENPNKINWHNVKTNFETQQEVCARLSKDYPVDQLADKKPVIIFIGSSQTWGAGASRPEKTIPALVEKKIRALLHDSTITVINCGIDGSMSGSLSHLYTSQWGRYKPLLTVVNLSTNDIDPQVLSYNLGDIIDYDSLHHIKTLLIKEPNDHPTDKLNKNHLAVDRVGKIFSIKVIDMQQTMDTSASRGFIWWDCWHLTDFGQQLFADRISTDIIETLQQNAKFSLGKVH